MSFLPDHAYVFPLFFAEEMLYTVYAPSVHVARESFFRDWRMSEAENYPETPHSPNQGVRTPTKGANLPKPYVSQCF